MRTEETYRTSNLYEAAYLLCRGHDLGGKEKVGKRTAVLFPLKDGVQQAALDYYAGATIEARMLADKYRALKDYVFSDITEHKLEERHDGISDSKRGNP
jgi:hypothetical protein